MKIIKQGKIKEEKKVTVYVCDDCGAEVEMEATDDKEKCPCCGSCNFLPRTIKKLSPDEEFPSGYYRFGESEGAKILDIQETRDLIKNAVRGYNLMGGGCCYRGTGDTCVIVVQTDPEYLDKYEIIVCKNYYSLEN